MLSQAILLSLLPYLSSALPTTASATNIPGPLPSEPGGASWNPDATSKAQPHINGSAYMYKLSPDPEFSFILEEYMSLADGGGSSTGEVLRAASQIIPGDFESFYSSFHYLATQVEGIAEGIDSKKHSASAKEAYYRAASYYRAADFFIHENQSDPRIYEGWDRALGNFDKANALESNPGVRVTLKSSKDSGGFEIPVIVWTATKDKNCKRPTIVVCNGFDGSQEAMWHMLGTRVIERGYNFVTFEGPGQPTPRRKQNLGFIPNWWDVVTPVVDYLEKQPYVDTKKMALEGISFGGTLAPVAASREHRFAAVLAIDGLYSLANATMSAMPPFLSEAYNSHNKTAFDNIIHEIYNSGQANSQFRWFFDQGMFSFDVTSPYELVTRMSAINLGGGVLEKIRVPVFVGSGQNDVTMLGQAEQVARELGDKGTYHLFRTDLGAGEHCQFGAEARLAQVSLDWLEDEVFSKIH